MKKAFFSLSKLHKLYIVIILLSIGCSSCEPLEQWVDVKQNQHDIDEIGSDDSGSYIDWQGRLVIFQFGIKWRFDKTYTRGQFANGDYWVLAPSSGNVKIIEITPRSIAISGRIINGSMINPTPLQGGNQGYDSSVSYGNYVPTLNVAFNISSSNPLKLSSGSSLVSTKSIRTAGNTPQLQNASVLTILSSEPENDSFRPPYSGTDKTVRYNAHQMRTNLLARLTPVPGTPAISTIERHFERVWLDHTPSWAGRMLHPASNMKDYGAWMSEDIGIGALMLNLDLTDDQKRILLIRFVQIGIDFYGILKAGDSEWPGGGAAGYGRKFAILFAGLILNDTNMMNIANNPPNPSVRFGEDEQTFYVTDSDVQRTHSAQWNPDRRYGTPMPYDNTDIGLPEWGIYHWLDPYQDDKAWGAAYRTIISGGAWTGFILSARIMNMQSLWGNNALFDYTDRYMAVTATSEMNPTWRNTSGNFIADNWGSHPGGRPTGFMAQMWDTYRSMY